jgi:hypothetical protein
MAELKKYISFKTLKLNEKQGNIAQSKNHVFLEFETFIKQLQSEYSNKKKGKTNNGKQPNR